MTRFERKFVEKTYYNIKNGKTPLPFLFTILETYLKRPLDTEQRTIVSEQAERIRNGEMSLEEYIEFYQTQRARFRIV